MIDSLTGIQKGNFLYRLGIDWNGDAAYIDRDDKTVVAVDLKIMNEIENHNGTTDMSYYSPIPLTLEILEKCGFRKGEKWYIHQVYYLNHFNLCYNKNEIVYGEKTVHGFDKKSKNICSIHQLQNLYFALTNTELIYKP